MNYRAVFKNLGIVLLCEAGLMIPSLLIALYFRGSDVLPFVCSIALLLLCGSFLIRIRQEKKELYARDGLAIVSIGWIMLSFFGALPFFLSGEMRNLADAFFEAVSGFTTTGATILNTVEQLPKGLMFWRSFTHWIGGMGVLVLTLAILPMAGAGAVHIMRAESPGPSPGKLVPRLGETAKILYILYFTLTAAQVIALLLAKMPLFDTLIHTFGTAGTGGFSNHTASVGYYNSQTIELIIGIFMILFGASFALYYQLIKGNWRSVLKDEELRLYLGIIVVSILLIGWDLGRHHLLSFTDSFRHAFFQVSSIITTTGFSSNNFDLWPALSKNILVLLMFIGASAGSTAGGIKCIRVLLIIKMIRREIIRMRHPQVIRGIRIGNRLVDQQILQATAIYALFYFVIAAVSILIVSLDSFDLVTNFTAVISCLGNVGPGLGAVGPTGSFAGFSAGSKIILSFCMLIGRLEIMPVVLLAAPSFWRKVSI